MDVEGKLYFPTTLMASAHGNFGVSKNNYSISIPSKQTNKQIGGEMKGNELILVPQAVLLCSCGPGETARASCLLDALSTPTSHHPASLLALLSSYANIAVTSSFCTVFSKMVRLLHREN